MCLHIVRLKIDFFKTCWPNMNYPLLFTTLLLLGFSFRSAAQGTCSSDVVNNDDSLCLLADFGSSSATNVQGTIIFCQTEAGNMTYQADIVVNDASGFGACTASGEVSFNWHFHQFPTAGGTPGFDGTACAAGITGGHVDDTFACGPATGESANCSALGRTVADGYVYDCTPESYRDNQYNCEVGDLSGKMGALCVPSDGSSQQSVGRDNTALDLAAVEGRSVVLHCGSPRVACATLESTAYTDIDVPLQGSGNPGCSSANDLLEQYIPYCVESDFGSDTSNIVSGSILFCQTATGNLTFESTVAVNDADEFADCTDGDGVVHLNWHFHQFETTGGVPGFLDDCGPAVTAGHFDPTLACGPASNEIAGDCVSIDRDGGGSYTYSCSPSNYEDNWLVCESGDLSGKLGQLCVPNDGTTVVLSGRDNTAPDLRLVEGRSVVLHCNAPRKACATLFEVPFEVETTTTTNSPSPPSPSPPSPSPPSPTEVSSVSKNLPLSVAITFLVVVGVAILLRA